MENAIQAFQMRIQSLGVSESEKSSLLELSAKCVKEAARKDFQVKRTTKDKSIMVNLLNRTIEELRLRQEEIELANHELKLQKQLC